MPRLRCVVDLKLRSVKAPGVYFLSREDVCLSVSLFGQNKSTRLLTSTFPLYIQQDLVFDKTYYTSGLSSEVLDRLRDELIVFELVQLSRYGGSVRLASYSASAREVLFPITSGSLYHSSPIREIPLRRLIDFPGENPIWLEFSTVTDITETILPEVDRILYRPTVTETVLYKPILTDTLLYKPTDRYGLRPLTAYERLDLERTERALQRSRSLEKIELEHLRALSKSRELARLEQDLEVKRRERLAREQLDASLRLSRARYLEDLELDKIRLARRNLYL
ncbi:spermatogenesis-associated protein 6-like [Saccostrea echinata]|uniref:spermatogenesis-associated protein 6-like n=1 Tax=Saccostrea echinata TaxID=191078 RepID=UPI002A7EEB91|nr:spermatogenesis-associated protein 6-like [Saccostrea echinata]